MYYISGYYFDIGSRATFLHYNMKSILIYASVILFVLYYSGFNKEMTFYKKHLITLYGTTIYSHSLSSSKDFYSKLLELPLLDETASRLQFRLPDNRVLTVSLKEDLVPPQLPKEVLTIRVRNGLPKLQESFKKDKLPEAGGSLSSSQNNVSDIIVTKRGKEFHLTDPSNNLITFFQRSIFSRGQ